MLKEIQSSGSGAQPGSQTAVGELQTSETSSSTVPSGSDSPAETEKLQTSADHCRSGASACAAGDHPCRHCGFFSGVVIFFIRIYQKLIAPLLPDCCRFEPTCSHYAVEALQVHGFWKGSLLTIWRLMRCQPFCKGGRDPVPPRKQK
jgi:putative membrane protein insertion efficiency factor